MYLIYSVANKENHWRTGIVTHNNMNKSMELYQQSATISKI